MGAKPDDGDHFRGHNQVKLLEHLGWLFAGHDGSMAIGACKAKKVSIINVVIGEGRPFMTRVVRLPAALSLAAVGWLIVGLFDEIAGRWLGGV